MRSLGVKSAAFIMFFVATMGNFVATLCVATKSPTFSVLTATCKTVSTLGYCRFYESWKYQRFLNAFPSLLSVLQV
jgi:hypothetical protein